MREADPNASDEAPEEVSARLEHVVDDLPAAERRAQAGQWADEELIQGRAFDAVIAELEASGWPYEDAESIVEGARRRTRAERGVVTREEVAKGTERRYRRTLASLRWIAFGGLPVMISGTRNLIELMRTAFESRKKAKLVDGEHDPRGGQMADRDGKA